MARTITFQPSPELGEFIEAMVESGSYANQSEVIRDSLRLLHEKTAKSKLTQLRKLIEEGENSGEPVEWSADKFLQRMKTRRKRV
ncbi:type II toxin-antitoxin system ParD family antitoxin [Marinibactrum halimedae]|uniref:Antitoxin ParD n=1 Tax=Marinibactrum halimedae TaxID=1444977 RepID=A0AA37WQS1_9GAMM|nr:type II toxin-antitoxin system ParD family antitoxin [Marinibactrum halimedae]MCD9458878.1 type II toxin-antitoxin system ParD family antitoxin [Marinibactrum halimedae]GLS27727.1 hypothetical protein GCM10007877_34460 [Marinibactrum halimedae]